MVRQWACLTSLTPEKSARRTAAAAAAAAAVYCCVYPASYTYEVQQQQYWYAGIHRVYYCNCCTSGIKRLSIIPGVSTQHTAQFLVCLSALQHPTSRCGL